MQVVPFKNINYALFFPLTSLMVMWSLMLCLRLFIFNILNSIQKYNIIKGNEWSDFDQSSRFVRPVGFEEESRELTGGQRKTAPSNPLCLGEVTDPVPLKRRRRRDGVKKKWQLLRFYIFCFTISMFGSIFEGQTACFCRFVEVGERERETEYLC